MCWSINKINSTIGPNYSPKIPNKKRANKSAELAHKIDTIEIFLILPRNTLKLATLENLPKIDKIANKTAESIEISKYKKKYMKNAKK